MTQAKEKVKAVSEQIYKFGLSQIIIDLVQDMVEEYLEQEDVTPDEIGSMKYECSILLEVYNPALEKDILFLNDLIEALQDWNDQATQVNKILGLDPNA